MEQPRYRPLPEADREGEGGEAYADLQSFSSNTSDHTSFAKKVLWPSQTSTAWARTSKVARRREPE